MEKPIEKIQEIVDNSKTISEALQYHLTNNIPLLENIFRHGSNKYFDLFNEAREASKTGDIELSPEDKDLLETMDIGLFEEYEGKLVPLDCPFAEEDITEAEYHGKEVQLNKPKRGGPKKYYVYVKDPKTGNVKKINFGDSTGLSAKIHNPEARKSFAARHKCHLAKDKTTANYWSCNLPRYSRSLGLGANMNTYW